MHLADLDFELSRFNATTYVADRMAGDVAVVPRREKVVIYGAGHGREQAPLSDLDWEVWCLNTIPAFDAAGRMRCDRWFELHQRCAQTEDDMRWIARCPWPIYVPDDLLNASPNAVRYPIERVEASFGSYFACTFAYQIALALLDGFTDIGLFGVELAYGTKRERTVEWASVSWWLGYAEARGVNVHLPFMTRLGVHPFRYGLEYKAEIEAVDEYLRVMADGDKRDEERRRQRASVGG